MTCARLPPASNIYLIGGTGLQFLWYVAHNESPKLLLDLPPSVNHIHMELDGFELRICDRIVVFFVSVDTYRTIVCYESCENKYRGV